MKKFFYRFALCILATVALVSCTRELVPEEPLTGDDSPAAIAEKIPMEFSAISEETKANISGNSILWTSGDKIAIFDGEAFNEFSVSSISGDGKGANFTGSAGNASTYYAVSPFVAATNINTANSRISIKIPGSQTVKEGRCVDPAALVSTAITSDNTLTFINQFSLVKVSISRSDVTSVMFQGNNDENISGTNHFYYDGDGAPRMDYTNAAGTQVTLTYKNGDGDLTTFPAGEYYLAIWPTTFSAGFKIIVGTEDGSKSLKYNSKAGIAFPRNGGYDLKAIDNAVFCSPVITTADELKMWRHLASSKAYKEGEVVKLGADINLNGYTWTPVTSFLGIFDGQNHKIYNFTVQDPSDNRIGFIRTLGSSSGELAEFKNVILGSSDGYSADGSSSIIMSIPESSSWSYAGVIGYAHVNSRVSNVTNFVPVTADAALTTKHAIAGLVGAAGNKAVIESCVNYGTITSNSVCETTEDSAVGGILGQTGNADVQILSCVNNGTINNYCNGVSCIGGIVAKTSGTGLLVDECSNAGEVNNYAACVGSTKGNWDISIGGVIGLMGSTSTVNKCSNGANLYNRGTTNSSYDVCYGGIVGATTKNNSVIKGCSNTAEFIYEAKTEFTSWLAAGGILGYSRGVITITKADDGTETVNTGQYFQRRNHTQSMYIGGIAGLIEKQASSLIEYCINEGRIVGFGDQTSTKKEFYAGGICGGASSGVISNCTNNGFLIARDGDHIAYFGGIAGSKNKYPSSILDCVNNGAISGYASSGSTRLGGLLAVFQPDQTKVRNCVANCLLTTGNIYTTSSGNTAGDPVNFQNKDYYKGGLFGEVLAPKADVTDNVTGCVVNCTLSNLTADKDGWTGIIAGQTKSTSSTTFKLVFGTASNPVKIVNTTHIEYGSNSNPATITPGDVINNEANARKWLMGSESKLYDASAGSSNKSIVDFNFSIVAP